MPNITQIQVGNTVYDITDETARRPATSTTIGLLNDAPSDGEEYIRKNGTWSIASSESSNPITISTLNEILIINF